MPTSLLVERHQYVNFTFGQDADGHEIASMTGNKKKICQNIFDKNHCSMGIVKSGERNETLVN